jgi:antitoxin component YwqK of YwqJK toxin-antitoxin module
MVKPIFFIAAGILLFSCSEPATNKTATAVDSSGKKGVSVSDPIEKQPHRVSDSVYNGEHIERYDNGVIFKRGDVQGGLRAGEWLTFYEDGKLWSKGTYENGLRQGYGVSYWRNGAKSSEGYYKDDAMVGKWKFWDEHGTMVEKDFGGEVPQEK